MILEFSVDALNDFKRLKKFIEINNPMAANTISMKLSKGIRGLIDFPKLGKKAIDTPNQERDIYILDYHIRYMFSEEVVTILRIWHQKEDR